MDEIRLGEEKKEALKNLISQESVVRKHPECPEVFDKLSINWDGTVTACCTDYDHKMLLGDILDSSIKKIWCSEKLNAYRTILAEMRHDELDLCKDCFDVPDNRNIQTPGL